MKDIDEDLKAISKEFGAFIKQKRKEQGLTLVDLAKRSELSHSYLSQLENGKRNIPPMATQIKICQALNISVLEIPTTEEHYYNHEDLDRFYREVNYEEVVKNVKILSKDADNFLDEVIKDPSFRRAMQDFDFEVGFTDRKVTPSGLLEDLHNADEDAWNYSNHVRDRLADLAEVFSKREQYVNVETKEILEFMNRSNIKFNGHSLSSEEKEQIVAMIKLMFPNKANKE